MNKSDLKTGMWVEDRSGDIGIVLLGTAHGDFIVYSGKMYLDLKEIDEDLKNKDGNDYLDIVKIYQIKDSFISSLIGFNADFADLLWERQPEPEYTDFMTAVNSGRRIRQRRTTSYFNNLDETLSALSDYDDTFIRKKLNEKTWEIEPERKP